MNLKLMLAGAAFSCVSVSLGALEIVSPKEGETVDQLWPEVKAFLDLPREARQHHADKISAKEKKSFHRHGGAKPIEFKWTGAAKGVYQLKVARVPDGQVFVETTVTGVVAHVTGRLEVGRDWTWSVSDGRETAKGTFKTEDRAPRIVALEGVRNSRDLGGWRGLDGRRVRQGMMLRTGGLNNNANQVYYSHEEILDLFKQGKLEGAGVGRNAADLSREYAAKLGRGNGIDKNYLRLIKEAPKGPGEERLTPADKAYLLGFWKMKSDLDLRGDWETFGMLFSPLGRDVNWYHYETKAGYGGVVTPVGRACQALNVSALVNPKNFPIDFHCIGGTDRTGTMAYLLNGFLGVSEEDLIRDYEMSFIRGGGVDKRHYSWLMGLVKAVRELPGQTIADKVWGYYRSLGFTDEQLADLRERLLEPAQTKSVRVADFGYDAADASACVRAAVASGAEELLFDAGHSPWVVEPLRFTGVSNRVIRFERGVELRAKPGAFHGRAACLMSFVGGGDVTLIGPGATFRMERDVYAKAPYEKSEHRHCLNLRGVRNFRVEGLSFVESGGDGIFIGGRHQDGKFVNSENVFLTDVVCDRNYRQGLSIICVSNFVAQGCAFSNTKGTPPQSGVDIEPNQSWEALSEIVFRDCRFENNAGRGLEFYIGNFNSASAPVTATLEGCRMLGNINGFEFQQNRSRYPDLPRGGRVTLRDCTIEKSTHAGILVIDKPASSARLVFENVTLADCRTVTSNAADVALETRLPDTPPTDGIDFRNVTVARPVARPWITGGRTDFTSTGIREIRGSVRLTTGEMTERVDLDDAWRAALVPLPADGPTRPRQSVSLSRARVSDPAPGEMRPLENVVLSGTHRIVIFAESARTVRFRVRRVKLHAKRPLLKMQIPVQTYEGSKVTHLNVPDADGEAELAFAAERAGFYSLVVEAGKQGFSFVAADVPVATEIREKPIRFGLVKGGFPLRFHATEPFSLFAGADSYERGAVRLLDPSGVSVWDRPVLTTWERYQGTGAEGLWTLVLERPKGISCTEGVDLTGVAGFLFLSRDRYWTIAR